MDSKYYNIFLLVSGVSKTLANKNLIHPLFNLKNTPKISKEFPGAQSDRAKH